MNDSITITNESEDEDVPESRFIKSVVDHTRNSLDSNASEINIQIVGDDTIRALNNQYRSKNTPTNVLSFGTDLPGHVNSDFIGDIVLCPRIIRAEAREFGKSVDICWFTVLYIC